MEKKTAWLHHFNECPATYRCNKKDSPSVSLGLLESLLLSDASMSASLAGDERTALRVILFTSSRTGSTDRLSLFLTDPVSSTSRYVITSFFSLTFWSKDLETNAVSSSITAPKKKKSTIFPLDPQQSTIRHQQCSLSIGLNARWCDEIFDNSSCCGVYRLAADSLLKSHYLYLAKRLPLDPRALPSLTTSPLPIEAGWGGVGGTLSVLQIHITLPCLLLAKIDKRSKLMSLSWLEFWNTRHDDDDDALLGWGQKYSEGHTMDILFANSLIWAGKWDRDIE